MKHTDEISLEEMGEQIKKVVHTVMRRRGLLLVVMVCCLVGTFAFYAMKPPVFEANATLVMDLDAAEIMNLERREPVRWEGQLLKTQMEVVTSKRVLGEAYKVLDLNHIHGDDQGINALRRRVSVGAVGKTRVFKISVRHGLAEEAARQTNTLVDTYLNFILDDRREVSNDAFLWLSDQLGDMKRKVEDSELALLKYKEGEHIISLEKRGGQLEQELAAKSEEWAQVDNRIKHLQAMLSGIEASQQQGEPSLPNSLQQPVIVATRAQLNEALVAYADISDEFKDKHPRMLALVSRIASLRGQLNREINKIVVGLRTELVIKQTQAEALKQSMVIVKRELMEISKQAVAYGALQREAESNRKLYNTLLSRLKEADLEGTTRANDVRVLDYASVPSAPINSSKKTILAIGLCLGLLLGCGLCMLLEIFDDAVIDEGDLHYFFQQEPLALIPRTKIKSEAYDSALRGLRISLEKERRAGFKTFMLTSPGDGEGKTTTLSYLGRVLARWGLKVLVVDCDPLKKDLSREYQLAEAPGLLDHLQNGQALDALIANPKSDNLFVLPVGADKHPCEALGSAGLSQMLLEVRDHFDMILLDTPPVNEVPEVAVLAAQVDGTMLVVRSEKTSRAQIHKALRALASFEGHLLGLLLTGMPTPKGSSAYQESSNWEVQPETGP